MTKSMKNINQVDQLKQNIKDITSKLKYGAIKKNKKTSRKLRFLRLRPVSFMNEVDGYTIGTTLCRKCGISFSPKGAYLCIDCLSVQEDFTAGMPKSLLIKHCVGCQSYSFSGTLYITTPPHSYKLLMFLIERITFHLRKLQLKFSGAKFLPTEPQSKKIRINLSLMKEALYGIMIEKSCVVEFDVVYQTCLFCLLKDNESQWSSVVQFRPYGSYMQKDMRIFLPLISLIQRSLPSYQVRMLQAAKEGFDMFFAKECDAMECCSILSTSSMVKFDMFHNSANSGSCIPARVCPISWNDLVNLGSKASASLGFLGPLVICTRVTSSITLLDPTKLTEKTLSASEYWNEPFQALMSLRDTVEFKVLNVEVILSNAKYSLAMVQVAQVSDFRKVFTVRTHLGYTLKPGDYALGYELCELKTCNMEAETCWDSLPDVVLIRKIFHRNSAMRKNTSPEYEELLKDLEKNSEGMFNLSLNSESNVKKQHQEVGSEFDLECLLADLALSSKEDVDNFTHSE